MSEWLDLMLEEIARKKREAQEAREEVRRRSQSPEAEPAEPPVQSK